MSAIVIIEVSSSFIKRMSSHFFVSYVNNIIYIFYVYKLSLFSAFFFLLCCYFSDTFCLATDMSKLRDFDASYNARSKRS